MGLAIAGVFFPPLELAAAESFVAAAAASSGTVLLAADVSLAIGVSLDVAVYEVHPTPANQAVVVGDAVGLALGYGAGKFIGAAVSKYGPAVAELFAQRAAQKTAQETEGIIINNPGAGDVRPAEIVRRIARGEKISDIVAEAKYRTFADGVEHAVIKTSNGERVLVSGGSKGIELPSDTEVLYGHTHPPVRKGAINGPSPADKDALGRLN